MIDVILHTTHIMIDAIILHELGHILYFRKLTKKFPEVRFINFKIRIGRSLDYKKLTKLQKKRIYFEGVFAGFIPIFIGAFINPSYILLTVPYLLGCSKDIKNILGLI